MRGLFCLLLCIITIISGSTAVADKTKDIVFSSIPWLSNDASALQSLLNCGFIRSSGEQIKFTHEDCNYLSIDTDNNVVPKTIRNNNYCFSTSLKEIAKGKVAGYPILDIALTFAYNGEYQLICVKVDLLGADYKAIKEKLTKVYGDCEEIETIEGHTYLWKGANDTCVTLLEYYDGNAFDLFYGRLDAEEILANCMITDSNDISGL